MQKIYLDDNIFYIENFIAEEEKNILLQEACNKKTWKDPKIYDEIWDSKIKIPQTINGKKILNIVQQRVKDLIDDENNIYIKTLVIQRIISNELEIGMNDHYDSGGHSETDIYITKGCVIYLNEDFDGGELEYVYKNIKIKPKSKMLVVHPGTKEYTHKVLNVKNGTRYMLSGFAYDALNISKVI